MLLRGGFFCFADARAKSPQPYELDNTRVQPVISCGCLFLTATVSSGHNSSNRRSSIMQRAWTRVLFLLVWMAGSALALQQPSNSPTSALISLLQQKEMISANEAAALRQSSAVITSQRCSLSARGMPCQEDISGLSTLKPLKSTSRGMVFCFVGVLLI